jgi:hypothetical protein
MRVDTPCRLRSFAARRPSPGAADSSVDSVGVMELAQHAGMPVEARKR